MNSAWYALSMVGIFLVIRWYIMNDGADANGGKGFLAMKREQKPRKLKRDRVKFSLDNVR